MLPTPSDSIAVFARLQPNKLAATELITEETWTYSELDNQIDRLAAYILASGGEAGDRLAVLARNSVLQVMLHLACARVGMIYVPLNWRLSSNELAELITRSRPRFLLADEISRPLLLEREDVHSMRAFVNAGVQVDPITAHARDPDRASLILFTSGTSGKSKGVMISERNMEQTAINFSMLTEVNNHSVFLCEAPMFHVIGMVTNIRSPFQQGGAIAVSDGFEPERTVQRLTDKALGVSHFMGVPQMVESFRKLPGFEASSLSHLTALVTGGAPHAPSDIEAWLDEGVSLVSGFGMSECGTAFGMPVVIDEIRKRVGSVGTSGPGIQTRIVDHTGLDLPIGESGELWLRGDNIMLGYWEDKETTAATFANDGWFKTGDIARCDEAGYFWLVDRKKDMFISGGENVYPAEIEGHLSYYVGLKEVAVVGIPDERWGEIGCIAMVPVEGTEIDHDELIEFLRERLASYKIPKRIVAVEALPRTATGKLQKPKLKELVVTLL